MKKSLFIIAIVALFFTSCVYSEFIPTTTQAYFPYKGIVAILYSPPNQPYQVIGTVIAKGEDASLGAVFKELQRKTAMVGGNAVIVRQSGGSAAPYAFPLATGGFLMSYTEIKEVVGTAIIVDR